MRPAPSLALSAFLLGGCLPTLTPVDSGPLTLNSPCDLNAEVDACMSWGYVCSAVDAGFSCQYPEFGDACLPSVGCDPDAGQLFCDEFSVDGGPEAVFPACGTPCSVPTDCLDSTATCYQAYLPDGGFIGACFTNSCDTAFASCTVSPDGGPGTCLPIGDLGENVCNQSGPVAVDGYCSGVPIDGGAYLCQPGELCSYGPSETTTVCLTVCYGSSCPGATTCVEDYYLCLEPCNTQDPNCPSPLTCGNLISGDGTSIGSYCTPP
jgi:hypothetical protein